MKKLRTMKYYVFYGERCTNKIKAFDRRASAMEFIADFTLKNLNNTDDNWISGVFFGKFINSEIEVQNGEV